MIETYTINYRYILKRQTKNNKYLSIYGQWISI